jgi:hypothetical protein
MKFEALKTVKTPPPVIAILYMTATYSRYITALPVTRRTPHNVFYLDGGRELRIKFKSSSHRVHETEDVAYAHLTQHVEQRLKSVRLVLETLESAKRSISGRLVLDNRLVNEVDVSKEPLVITDAML